MEYRILGSLEVVAHGTVADLGPPKQRAVLAVLLLHANEIVATDRLIDLVWPERPPRTAVHSVQIYVSELRKAIEPLAGCPAIATRPPGYMLEQALRRGRAADAARWQAQADAWLRSQQLAPPSRRRACSQPSPLGARAQGGCPLEPQPVQQRKSP